MVVVHSLLILSTLFLLIILYKELIKSKKEPSDPDDHLNNIFDSLDVAIWSHNLKSDVLLITPGIEKLYGYKQEQFYQDTLLWRRVIHPDDLYVLRERENSFKLGKPWTSVYRINRPDGEVRWIQDKGFPTLDKHGALVYFASVLFDITDRKESEDLYRGLVELSPDVIAVIYNGNFVYINESGVKMLGAKNQKELLNKSVTMFLSNDEYTKIQNQLKDCVKNEKSMSLRIELSITRLNGVPMDLELSIMPNLYGGRKAFQLIGRDITERKRSEKVIHQMAYYDSLTGVSNRNGLKQKLDELINYRSSVTFGVFFLDLDRFKLINDTRGHSTGDLLLKAVARQLTMIVQHDGQVFRQGGDEFIILLEGKSKKEVRAFAKQILHVFSIPIEIEKQEFYITPSIGISMYPEDGKEQESLLRRADAAMYNAKAQGKNTFQFYYAELDKGTSRKMELDNALRKAIELNQLFLCYQPKIHLETGEVLGVEALLRWDHPSLGLIYPDEFISLAEETGLIVPIGQWVIQRALEQSKDWEEKGLGKINVAVNISVRQMQDDSFVNTVEQIVEDVGMEPSRLELEITESIMQDPERSVAILHKLKALNIMLAIDDFGTGYSSLSKLRYLPIDHIKIDKSFVDDIPDFTERGSIVKAIIEMGKSLNFTIIAEGIEKEEQIAFLVENSCIIGQGYHLSVPLTAEQIELFLKKQM
ncbi:EAL domain-containing protein [Aquibacillus koreensis]|uniref:EAL domain-containing protein n=1 Tax=Aquibacillus koreensis TaxID=279446 RepID=A0A9X3WJY7_9BACI|nr:GGDEF and EAL domain-containing protein [Aquibacillus koreensis]MCT2535712.1 EAL domain-containing protein [Aquibacillus koreensis]MDC3420003.1 EAL domain-containing protein [Aquibacillus koreensis]